MTMIGDRPIFVHSIDALVAKGVSRIVVSLGPGLVAMRKEIEALIGASGGGPGAVPDNTHVCIVEISDGAALTPTLDRIVHAIRYFPQSRFRLAQGNVITTAEVADTLNAHLKGNL